MSVPRTVLQTVALAAVVAVGPVPVAAAAPGSPAAPHCVVHVTGRQPTGELRVSAARCYDSFAGAMRAEGVDEWGPGAGERAAARSIGGEAGRLSFTLATHFDRRGLDPSGGTTSTVGDSCSGGWLNASAAWNDRISSTSQGCPHVKHFSGANRTGSSHTTAGSGGNLSAGLDNRTSSIQYNP